MHSVGTETWFEITDIAPVIDNEMHTEYNADLLTAGKSGLLPNDTIEPHPRQIDNILYQSDDSESVVHGLSKKEDDHFYHVLNPNHPPQFRIPLTSHIYEDVPSNKTSGMFASTDTIHSFIPCKYHMTQAHDTGRV